MATLQHQDSMGMVPQEFDFGIGGLAHASNDAVSPLRIASADELFYEGQLLPLHRYGAVQQEYDIAREKEQEEEEEGKAIVMEKEVDCWRFVSLSSCPTPAIEEVASFNSCRTDAAELRSCSFQSKHRGYWESALEKESSSSSRESYGSTQNDFSPTQREQSQCGFTSHNKLHISKLKWKSFLGGLRNVWPFTITRTGGNRKKQNSGCRVGFSEDLTKYRKYVVQRRSSEVKDMGKSKNQSLQSSFSAIRYGSSGCRNLEERKRMRSCSRRGYGIDSCPPINHSGASGWLFAYHNDADKSMKRPFSSPLNSHGCSLQPSGIIRGVWIAPQMEDSTIQELHSAIQSAIAHCKQSSCMHGP